MVFIYFRLQISLDVIIVGPNVDSRYVGEFRLKAKVWTRGDKQTNERLQFLSQPKEIFPVCFGAFILCSKVPNQ